MLVLNARLGAPEPVLDGIRRLGTGQAVAVIGGQQPAPAAGPLYSLYKAATVVTVARDLRQRGIPTVPVFWVHSDDHDFAEVATLRVWDRHDRIIGVTLEGQFDRTPVGGLPPGDIMAQLADALGSDMGLEPVAPDEGDDLGQWQARVLIRLFGESGLIVFDPRLPAARLAAVPVLAACAARREWDRIAARGQAKMRAAGHEPGLELASGHSCLFRLSEHGREPVMWDGDSARIRSGSFSVRGGDLVRAIEDDPLSFSPNVAVRPFVQDALFPVAVAVSGPGEAAYLPVLDGFAGPLGRTLAPAYPRISLTIVDARAADVCRDSGVSLAELRTGTARDALLSRLGAEDIDALVDHYAAVIDSAHLELTERLSASDPALSEIGSSNRERIAYQIEYLREKARQRHRRRHREQISRLEQAASRLWPDGPQERTLAAVSYLARYGTDLVTALLSVPPDGLHRELAVGEGMQ